MPLWGSVDNAANSVISVTQQVNKPVTVANRNALFGNTTPNVFVQGQSVGQFGVDVTEQQASQHGPRGAHAGWVLRTEGTGGRAGRVFVETLVAMGSMTGDADSVFPEYSIQINTQPQNKSVSSNTSTSFSVDAKALPEGTTITYQWQRNGANISEAGIYSGTKTHTLAIANTTGLNGNSYGVIVYAGDVSELSANAVLTVA